MNSFYDLFLQGLEGGRRVGSATDLWWHLMGCSRVAIVTAIYCMKFSFDATIATCEHLH